MRKTLIALGTAVCLSVSATAQQVEFDQYTLDNGLHVVLHQDKSAPVVVTSVMYHVGAKDENPERTGFAHFFEHLLFEGTKNIERGEWFKLVTANGGQNNANTTEDRTYYYEVFPSNNLELALWMESERLMHPVINQIGVDTQNEVVKEEKRLRVDNNPYGRLWEAIKVNLFKNHPYRWTPIGEMEHLDAATLDEFLVFNKKFYIPNNAVLVVAGDFEKEQAKKWIAQYFGPIPKGEPIVRNHVEENPITQTIKAEFEDPNIQLPLYVTAYRLPSAKERDSKVLQMITAYLSGGKSSSLYKTLVDDKKMVLNLMSFIHPYILEDYQIFLIGAIPMGEVTHEHILEEIDKEIAKLQTDLISEREYQKLQNTFENQYVNNNADLESLAHNLANYYLLYQDIDLINTEIDIYRSITREEIREVAKKYLNPNQRLVLDYIPEKESKQ